MIITHENYPPLLRQIYAPPRKLYYKGDVNLLEKTCIAIVGTRKPTQYGEYMTEKIIEDLKVLDVAIVSGLAKGIDTIAHESALKNNIPTIAVLGSGLENIYPKQNQGLADKIAKNGLLISEYGPTVEPKDFHFPQRNRIISGLSVATIMIEAPEKSGALITARFALEQGREIFAVPGDADRENSIGALRLLQNGGAYPVSSGFDIIEVLKKQPHLFGIEKTEQKNQKIQKNKSSDNSDDIYNLTTQEKEIFSAIPHSRPISLDQILDKGKMSAENYSAQNILGALSILEIKGLIFSEDGKYMRKLLR